MAFRFFRRIKIAPGITLNLSKSGPSVSLGPRGAKLTFGRRGTRTTLGLPGTGAYYTSLHRRRSGKALPPRQASHQVTHLETYSQTLNVLADGTSRAFRGMQDAMRSVQTGHADEAVQQLQTAQGALLAADEEFERVPVPAGWEKPHALMQQGMALRIEALSEMVTAVESGADRDSLLKAAWQKHKASDRCFTAAEATSPHHKAQGMPLSHRAGAS